MYVYIYIYVCTHTHICLRHGCLKNKHLMNHRCSETQSRVVGSKALSWWNLGLETDTSNQDSSSWKARGRERGRRQTSAGTPGLKKGLLTTAWCYGPSTGTCPGGRRRDPAGRGELGQGTTAGWELVCRMSKIRPKPWFGSEKSLWGDLQGAVTISVEFNVWKQRVTQSWFKKEDGKKETEKNKTKQKKDVR